MFERYEPTPEFATLVAIAEAIRNELGPEVEACPGFRAPEQAEPLNRAFRAIARRLLVPVVAAGDDLSALVSCALRRIAGLRLAAGGLDESQIRTLIELEPGTPDDWAGFLILVPWTEVLFWLASANADPE